MDWKIFLVIFTKLIPRKNFFLYCKNFGVDGTFCQEEGILLQMYAIEMGGVSRYFSKVSGSGVALTLVTSVL